MLLGQLREVVCNMWDVANQLDEKGIGKIIPFIPDNNDVRHTMKAEVILMLLEITGEDSMPNADQMAFLQYVLHAPINNENKKDFLRAIKSLHMIRFNPLIPYLVLIDHQIDSKLAKVYLDFQSTIALGYIKCADEVDMDMLLRYIGIMMKNKAIVEKGYEEKIDFDPLNSFEDDKKEMLEKMYALKEKIEEDEFFERVMQAMTDAINGEKSSDSKAKDYENFKKEIDENKDKYTDKSENQNSENVTDFDEEPRTREEIQADLDNLIGLEEVKAQVRSMFNVVQIRQECKNRGITRQSMSYHMVFSGNPGTGKTTVARLIAEIYHDMGLLSKGQLVEVSRADLVAGYVGHTAMKVQDVLKQAKGGVLFIDEAYSLASHSGNDFGHEAIETLIKGMEDNRDDLVIIVAGYPTLMNEFLNSNPGLSSRFTKTIYFSDYTAEELTSIFKKFCKENSVKANKGVIEIVQKYFEAETMHKSKNFGNARMVRNFFEQTMINQANRLVQKENVTDGMLCNITMDDVPKKIIIDKMRFFKV